MTKRRLQYLYTTIIVLFMPVGIYNSGLSTLSISDIFLLSIVMCLSVFQISKGKKLHLFLPLLWFLLFVVFRGILSEREDGELERTARFAFYVFVIVLFSKDYFAIHWGLKLYERIAVFATVFLIIQYMAFHFLHFYIPGYLPFLEVTREELVNYSDGVYYATEAAQRMRSIFQEPAQYASYVSVCLAIIMIENPSKKIITKLTLTTGLVLASSTTGYAVAILCWIAHLMRNVSSGLSVRKTMSIMFLVFVGYTLYSSSASEVVMTRLESGNTQANRFQGYEMIWQLVSEDPSLLLFGVGMKLYNIYLAGWSRMLFYFGIIGGTLYIIPLLLYSLRIREKLLLCILLSILGMGTSIILSGNSMLLLSFIASKGTIYQMKQKAI